jgi:hypothetical protein
MDCKCCHKGGLAQFRGIQGLPEGLKPAKITGLRGWPRHLPSRPAKGFAFNQMAGGCNGGRRRRTITQVVKFQTAVLNLEITQTLKPAAS